MLREDFKPARSPIVEIYDSIFKACSAEDYDEFILVRWL